MEKQVRELTVSPAGIEGLVVLHMQTDREVAHCVSAYEPAHARKSTTEKKKREANPNY